MLRILFSLPSFFLCFSLLTRLQSLKYVFFILSFSLPFSSSLALFLDILNIPSTLFSCFFYFFFSSFQFFLLALFLYFIIVMLKWVWEIRCINTFFLSFSLFFSFPRLYVLLLYI